MRTRPQHVSNVKHISIDQAKEWLGWEEAKAKQKFQLRDFFYKPIRLSFEVDVAKIRKLKSVILQGKFASTYSRIRLNHDKAFDGKHRLLAFILAAQQREIYSGAKIEALDCLVVNDEAPDDTYDRDRKVRVPNVLRLIDRVDDLNHYQHLVLYWLKKHSGELQYKDLRALTNLSPGKVVEEVFAVSGHGSIYPKSLESRRIVRLEYREETKSPVIHLRTAKKTIVRPSIPASLTKSRKVFRG